MTCEVRASRARRRPTSTATWPADAGIDLVEHEGRARCRPPASTTSIASMTRDSSPPEAPLPNGPRSLPRVRREQHRDVVGSVGA